MRGAPARGVMAAIAVAGLLVAGAGRLCGSQPDDLLLAGRVAVEDALYGVAQSQLEAYFQVTGRGGIEAGQFREALDLLMRALYEQGKYAAMTKFLDAEAGRVKAASAEDAAAYWRATAQYEAGDAQAALAGLAGFDTAYAGGAYRGRAGRLRAWCLLKLGRTDEALAEFAALDKAAPDAAASAGNLLEWAKALLAADRVDAALEVLARVSKLDAAPEVLQEARCCNGQALVLRQRWDEAMSLLVPLAGDAAAPADLRARSYFLIADVQQAQTNMSAAAESLTEGVAIAQAPMLKRQGMRRLGMALLGMGRIADGVLLLKEFVASAPEDPLSPSMQLALAEALLDSGSNEQARVEFRNYAETFTNVLGQAQAARGRGWALLNLGRPAEAATAFAKAYELFPGAEEKQRCLFKVGDAYFANGQYKLADETYARLLAEFPDSALGGEVMFQRGECAAAAGDAEAAEDIFRKVMQTHAADPIAGRALLRIAELREAQGRFGGALDAFTQLVNTDTNGTWLAEALFGRAKANYQLLRFQPALSDFERVVTLFPTNPVAPEAYYWSGMCCYWLGRDQKALAISRDFVNRYSDSRWASRAMFWVAKYEFNAGAYEAAEKGFLAFVERYPQDAQAADGLLWAGKAAAQRAEYLRAVELLGRLVQEYPESPRMAEARFAQGDALCNLAKFPEAIVALDEIVNKFPDSDLVAAAWLRKGDCQFMLGAQDSPRYDEAIASFRTAANLSGASTDIALPAGGKAMPPAAAELLLQAEYKIGRCLEKLGRIDAAAEQYYAKVIVRFLEARDKGVRHSEGAKTWFTRACFSLADILEARKEWRQEVNILERVVESGVPVTEETRERIRKIRAEHWWLFY